MKPFLGEISPAARLEHLILVHIGLEMMQFWNSNNNTSKGPSSVRVWKYEVCPS